MCMCLLKPHAHVIVQLSLHGACILLLLYAPALTNGGRKVAVVILEGLSCQLRTVVLVSLSQQCVFLGRYTLVTHATCRDVCVCVRVCHVQGAFSLLLTPSFVVNTQC